MRSSVESVSSKASGGGKLICYFCDVQALQTVIAIR